MTIAYDVHAAGAYVREADGATLDAAMAGFIGRFVAPAFGVSSALIEDSAGARTERLSAVVHTGDVRDGVVGADDAAAAVYASGRSTSQRCATATRR